MPFQIEVIQGDLTHLTVGAIVNAANNSLLGGGGVDGAIHSAAGPDLLIECRQLGGCPTGEARITRAYRLPASRIIHTVGPVWQGGSHKEAELLTNSYKNSLMLAEDYKLQSIAFPAISTGVYGYPGVEAACIAIQSIQDFEHQAVYLQRVILVGFNQAQAELYQKILKE